MDWNHVTAQEVLSALREVEWKEPPRPLWEMLQPSRFSVPRSRKKWAARTKNSMYYYRVNYALALLLCTAVPLLRRPTALLAVAACCLALLCLNDTFATSLSQKRLPLLTLAALCLTLLCLDILVTMSVSDALMRGLRRVNVRLAQRIRASAGGHCSIGHVDHLPGSRKSGVKVCGVPRLWLVAALGLLGVLLLQRSRALLTLAWSLSLGCGLVALHATFRSPNLKARLGSAREEFRALWRGYQANDAIIDYTL